MAELYLIRHGATPLNGDNSAGSVDRIRGWSDVPLSPKGRKDAEKLGEQLKGSGIQIIHFSTLQRARDTAEAIAKTTGAQMVPSPDLRPWNVGTFTGKDSNDAHPELRRYATQTPDKPIPEGESFNQFKGRVLGAVAQIAGQAGNTPTAIVTHHRVERLMKAIRPDGSINPEVMFQHGEPTGHAEKIQVDPNQISQEARPAASGPAKPQGRRGFPKGRAQPRHLAQALQPR